MTAQPPPGKPPDTDILDLVLGRLREADALLDAIQRAEYLDAGRARTARGDAQAVASILSILRRDLRALCSDVESAICVQSLITRVTYGGRGD